MPRGAGTRDRTPGRGPARGHGARPAAARPAPGGIGARKAAQGASTPEVAAAQGAPDNADTLLDALDWHLERHPDRVHVFLYGSDDRAEPIPYEGLAQGAARVASRLRREGLARGDTVALMLPTGQEYFFGFVGILAAGGIPVPIYPPARLDQIEEHLRRHARILDNARTAFLITVPQGRAVGRLLRAQVGSLRAVLTLEDLERETPIDAPARPGPQDIAMLQYTSGSTGDPKGVVLSHADLLANIRAMGSAIGVRADDRFVSWLPLYHDMGLIGAWLGSLYFGLPLVVALAARLPRPAPALAAGHPRASGHAVRRAQLRLRAVPDPDRRRGSAWPGPRLLALGFQRGRAGEPPNAPPVRGAVRPLWSQPSGSGTRLRTRGGGRWPVLSPARSGTPDRSHRPLAFRQHRRGATAPLRRRRRHGSSLLRSSAARISAAGA